MLLKQNGGEKNRDDHPYINSDNTLVIVDEVVGQRKGQNMGYRPLHTCQLGPRAQLSGKSAQSLETSSSEAGDSKSTSEGPQASSLLHPLREVTSGP